MGLRVVVFSDSHRNFFRLKKIIDIHPVADLYLHLGDGEREFEDLLTLYPHLQMLMVQGNCDWGSDRPIERVLTCRGKRVFFTHGHLYRVKSGTEELAKHARELKADVALFGHTHQALSRYQDGLYLLNPGSIGIPRKGPPSYGLVDITDAGIAINVIPL